VTDTDLIWNALLAMQRMSWEQGVASHAAIDAGKVELAKALAHDAVVRQDAHGRLGATGDTGLVNGGALMEATRLLGVEGAEALERQRWALLRYGPRDDSGVLWHLEGLPEVWVDTVYMVVPALVVTGDFAPADMQYRMHKEHLWDSATGLYRHRVNTLTGEHVRGALWATGNGWVAAGLARALRLGAEATPEEMRTRWQREALALLEACRQWERADGRFHDVLDDPETFVDGTAGLMFAYAAFTGVADGWLDSSWHDAAQRWTDGALAYVGSDGLVREVCGAPHFDKQGTSAEAQAFALLALSASKRLSAATRAQVQP
jgi:unsaturated rhamnogalacturonyl hydrolase